MKARNIMGVAALGLIAAIVSAFIFGMQPKPLPPAYSPPVDPYKAAIYAEGIIESPQATGENITVYPEVAGPVTRVFVREGQAVRAGDPLLSIDDSVPRANADQALRQAQAAGAMLAELKAEPRRETLDVAQAQMVQAQASLRLAQQTWEKTHRSYELDARSVSKDTLDSAENTFKVAKGAADVATRQYLLTKAGAWSYDITNQDRQYKALTSASVSANALLSKYVLRAPVDGIALAVNAAAGGYVSPQGVYDTYTQANDPVVVISRGGGQLQVRTYVDEVLVQQLPSAGGVTAEMTVRGSNVRIPLRFVRMQPVLSPKIQLSDERQERVDVRVLPLIFSFAPPKGVGVYPGQLVDVFIARR